MRINTNVAAMNTLRILGSNQANANKNIGRLSSGFRINSASDDAAGLGIANKLRADVRSMRQASRNAEQASAMLQIAEGATQTIADILDRMKELATQAGSDNTDDAGRTRIMQEFDALLGEIDMIANTTKFQGKALLNGTFGNTVDTDSSALDPGTGLYEVKISGTAADTYTLISDQANAGVLRIENSAGEFQEIQVTENGKQTVVFDMFGITLELDSNFTTSTAAADGSLHTTEIEVKSGDNEGKYLVRSSGSYTSNDLVHLDDLNLTTGSDALNLDSLSFSGDGTAAEWRAALSRIDEAISHVNSAFGSIGAAQNRIDYANQNLKTAIENFSAAESTIRDVDMAEEMTAFSKNQILLHSATAMLAQANQAPQSVLRLIG